MGREPAGPVRHRRRFARAVAVCALTSLALCLGSTQAQATVTVPPVADSYVNAGATASNFGTAPSITAALGPPVKNIYLRFNVSGLTEPVTRATLQLVTSTTTAKSVTVGPVADNLWGESSITWQNAPPIGAAVSDSGTFNAGATVSIDVTKLVQGNGLVSMGIKTSAVTDKTFASRESTTPPRLVIDTAAPSPPPSSTDPVIAAAGDIACSPSDANYNGGAGTTNYCRQRDTANLLLNSGLTGVITLGDNQYENGELSAFKSVFDSTWGAAKAKIRASTGNREYNTSGAAGYFDYFNGAGIFGGPAGDRDKGYFSYDIGTWHLVSLNSNCAAVGGCSLGSAQEQWLRSDLAAHPNQCTLAYWHHPLFTSGQTGNATNTRPLYQDLYDAGADIVLAGHDHDYERFAPQSPTGTLDTARGIRQFVVGTGGESHHPLTVAALANEEVRNDNAFGVLRLALHSSSYDWRFEPIAGQSFTDSGSAACH